MNIDWTCVGRRPARKGAASTRASNEWIPGSSALLEPAATVGARTPGERAAREPIRSGRALKRWALQGCAAVLAVGLAGCGGSGTSPPPPERPDVIQTIAVALSPDDVVGGSQVVASATANVRYNETDDAIEITVTVSDLTASAASLRTGFAGSTGDVDRALAVGANANDWTLGTTPLTAAEITSLEAGELYLTVSDDTGIALRGQILPTGVDVTSFDLSAEQVTSNSTSGASGTAWITTNTGANVVTVNLVTTGLTDAVSAEIRRAAAGANGPVLFDLAQDTSDSSLWRLATTDLPADVLTAANLGEVYATVATMAAPDGAIRGQLVPDDIELVITDLNAAALVMSGAKAQAQNVAARAMTTIRADSLSINLNTFALPDADGVMLRRAPAGQNGPAVLTLMQDINDPNLWSLSDATLDAALSAGLANRTLYIEVTTPGAPDGAARGQIETAESQLPPDSSAFVVTSIVPANAAEVTSLPNLVVATLNREPLAVSVSPAAVEIQASGGDGSFSDGNEVSIVPASVTANGLDVEISLAGVVAEDDVYRVSLMGGGSDGIVDQSGIPLDGDADGEPGGAFEAAFELLAPAATFSAIQETIFTPTCATAGCHVGAGAPDGLDLSAGMAYADTVNVASVQMSSLLLIEPGNPDDSYLVRKVEGVGIVANRMPLGAAPLTAAQIALIRDWVSAGAENN